MKNGIIILVFLTFSCTLNKREGATNDGVLFGGLFDFSSKKELSPVDYISFIKENESGLTQQFNSGDIIFSIKYLPQEFLTLKEVGTLSPSQAIFDSVLNSYGGMDYYSLSIKKATGNDNLLKYKETTISNYANRVEYYSFRASKDFKVITLSDTNYCALHHFEQSYGVSPEVKILFGVKKDTLNASREIVFEDRVFEKGTIRVDFEASVFNSLPILKL